MDEKASWKEVAKDGKPPKSGQYHVYCAGTSLMFVTTYDPQRGADFDEFVTHWRELPEPPVISNNDREPMEVYLAQFDSGLGLTAYNSVTHAIADAPWARRIIRFREVIE